MPAKVSEANFSKRNRIEVGRTQDRKSRKQCGQYKCKQWVWVGGLEYIYFHIFSVGKGYDIPQKIGKEQKQDTGYFSLKNWPLKKKKKFIHVSLPVYIQLQTIQFIIYYDVAIHLLFTPRIVPKGHCFRLGAQLLSRIHNRGREKV